MSKPKKNNNAIVKPYHPIPFRPPNKDAVTYEELFTTKNGQQCLVTKADYTDKKGNRVLGYWLYVKWID